MKKLILKPEGWPCSIEECPPGFFVFNDVHVGFKTEYHSGEGGVQAYNEAGEHFVPRKIMVQPVYPVWEGEG